MSLIKTTKNKLKQLHIRKQNKVNVETVYMISEILNMKLPQLKEEAKKYEISNIYKKRKSQIIDELITKKLYIMKKDVEQTRYRGTDLRTREIQLDEEHKIFNIDMIPEKYEMFELKRTSIYADIRVYTDGSLEEYINSIDVISAAIREDYYIIGIKMIFRNIISGIYIFRTIQPNLLVTVDDLINEIDEIVIDNPEGSDKVDKQEYEFVSNIYDLIINKKIFVGESNIKEDKILFKLKNNNNSNDKLCGYNALINLKLIDENILTSNEYLKKELYKLDNFKYYICANKINVNIILNNLGLDIQNNNIRNFFKENINNSFRASIKSTNGYKHGRLYKIDVENIRIFYLYECKESDKYIIYDHNNLHFMYTDNLIIRHDIYFTNKYDIYVKEENKDSYITIQSDNKFMHIGKEVKIIKKEDIKTLYVVIDYETIINFSYLSIAQPYSLSVGFYTNDDLYVLDMIERMKNENKTEDDIIYIKTIDNELEIKIKELINKDYNTKTFLGFDCTVQFIEYLKNYFTYKIIFVTYNGSNFDNFILMNDLLNIHTECITEIFYNNNSILNFKYCGLHECFDVRKHITVGTLSSICKSFNIKTFCKKEFNHYEAQQYFNNNIFDHYLSIKKDDIIEYNKYDVLSLALIFKRYIDKLKVIGWKEESEKIYKYKTLAQMVNHKLNEQITKLKLQETKYYVNIPKKLYIDRKNIEDNAYEKNVKHIKKSINKKNMNISKIQLLEEENKLLNQFYIDLQSNKTGGRVQLFIKKQIIYDTLCSMDVCSLYPYVMFIMKNAYYPYGKITPISYEEYITNFTDKIGFFYCDVIQPENDFTILANKTQNGNDWTSTHIKNKLLSTVMIDYIKSLDNFVIDICQDKQGYIFDGKIEGYKLFEFLLPIMKIKIDEDIKPKDKRNSVLREVAKFIMNCLSGKCLENLHYNVTTLMSKAEYIKYLTDGIDINILDCLDEGNYITNYNKDFYELIRKKIKPIHIGVLIYDYSKIHMYEHVFKQIDFKEAIYMDTDSIKMLKCNAIKWINKYASKTIVPHWFEVEEYDERLKDHKLYMNNSKVFGSFEDEYNKLKQNYHVFAEKKSYLDGFLDENKILDISKNSDGDYNFKFVYKGIKLKDIFIDEDIYKKFMDIEYSIIYNNSKLNKTELEILKCNYLMFKNEYYNTSDNKILNNLINFMECQVNNKPVFILSQSLRRTVNNPNSTKLVNNISMSTMFKIIGKYNRYKPELLNIDFIMNYDNIKKYVFS